MKFTRDEVMEYVREEDVKFIRLSFCDVFGRQKNVAIQPTELDRAFRQGIVIDGSAIDGFGGRARSDLLLRPDPATLTGLPWRPQHGRVVNMFCDITRSDGEPFPADARRVLKEAVAAAEAAGIRFSIGSEIEFYLFKLDENGAPTKEPCDRAGYMDIAPEDKGENVRREICLTLEQMGIQPESSHHESGPGQNEIDFRYADPLTAAEQAILFRAVVRTIAAQNGLWADFSPRPLPDQVGSGMHINLSAHRADNADLLPPLIAGLLRHVRDMTLFLNPCEGSYDRLGRDKAAGFVCWGSENRSALIRLPAASGEYRRLELRSPDPTANPYLAFALVLFAGLDGIRRGMLPSAPTELDLYAALRSVTAQYKRLPASLEEARRCARDSDFIRSCLTKELLAAYL